MTPAETVAAHAGLARAIAAKASRRWPLLDRDDALSLAMEAVWKATGGHPEGTPAMAWDAARGRPFAWWAARLAWMRVRAEVAHTADKLRRRPGRRGTVSLDAAGWGGVWRDHRLSLAAEAALAVPCVGCGTRGGYVARGRRLPFRRKGRCQKCHDVWRRQQCSCSASAKASP